MSMENVVWASDQRLPPEHKLVLVMLSLGSGTNGHSSAHPRRLAAECGLTAARTMSLLRALAAQRYLTIHSQGTPDDLWTLQVGGSEDHPSPLGKIEAAGSVYIASAPDGRCKIGISAAPMRRARGLSTTAGVKLTVVFASECGIDTARAIERALLAEFAAVRVEGEWVHAPAPQIIEVALQYLRAYGREGDQ